MKKLFFLYIFTFAFIFSCGPSMAAEGAATVAGYSAEEALKLGEAMYMKGRLPSGKPMRGVVRGDIPVKGTMATCSHCHMPSGLGSIEGGVVTFPTNGAKLFSPRRNRHDVPGIAMDVKPLRDIRPAYTDETLAMALRFGVDPTYRMLDGIMPRYELDDREMEVMLHYLKNLSSKYSPGATAREIRLSTVISEKVGPEERNALLGPLKAFVKRYPRKLSLEVWELKGPADTWGQQLETFYRKQPVFAIAGGLVRGSWGPVHEFCEKNRVPCIFPVTDLPVVSESDRYTLYFSKGYYQEGEAAAKYLARVHKLPPDGQVIQVFRDNEEGKALARGFEETWKRLGKTSIVNRILSGNETTGSDFWKKISAAPRDAAIMVWMGPEELAGLGSLAEPDKPPVIFVSSTLLKEQLQVIPDKVRELTFITYPFQLPEEREYLLSVVDQVYRDWKVTTADKTISAKAFTLIRLLSKAIVSMKNDLYRDYLLDLFDMQMDQTGNAVMYPRLSFGPGQRYASKGCHIVTLTRGQQPKLVKRSEWMIY